MNIDNILSEAVGLAFCEAGLPMELGRVVPSQRKDLCDFQCNGALTAGKRLARSPADIAAHVTNTLKADKRLADVALAGPGFINIRIADQFLSSFAADACADERCGIDTLGAGKVVLDYGGPNIAKAMHVGHLRSAIIGDSLNRIFSLAGHDTVSDIHLGDWGNHIGILISAIARRQPGLPYFDVKHSGPYPESSPVSLDDLQHLYPLASAECKQNEELMQAARAATAQLQDGRRGYIELWRRLAEASVADIRLQFDTLGVQFDTWDGESSAHALIGPLINDLLDRGMACPSQGAIVMDVSRPDDKKQIPPLLLKKGDGAVLYATTDLATIVKRVQEHHPVRIAYIVDKRQSLHFQQVFRAAEEAGLCPGVSLEHIGFGTINGPDGRPFKTRDGGVMRLTDLVQMATEKAKSRLSEAHLATGLSGNEVDGIARRVAISAIKFSDLSNYRMSDYVFDVDRFVSFEGKTGPYLLYALVRIRSILKRALEKGTAPGELVTPLLGPERALLLQLCRLPEAFRLSYEGRCPDRLCNAAFELAQVFSTFYESCPVLQAETPELIQSRLKMCHLVSRQLELILHLLGIDPIDKM